MSAKRSRSFAEKLQRRRELTIMKERMKAPAPAPMTRGGIRARPDRFLPPGWGCGPSSRSPPLFA
jgi:hypothetical protein